MDKKIEKIEGLVSNIQQLFFSHEKEISERYEKYGLDNIVGFMSLYDFSWYVQGKEYDKAMKECDTFLNYALKLEEEAATYKPLKCCCTWRGFDSELYYMVVDLIVELNSLKEQIATLCSA